jgi:glycosyltransferase involved in cell wall biosynthesis
MTGVDITAIVCTRDRSASLERCLAALAAQTLAAQSYEVIVVDNGSKDGTATLAAAFCERHTSFRYVFEERVGLSIARNTGVQLSSSDILAFTDDDAEPEASWLERLLERFRQHGGNVGIVGGDVIPVWEIERPAWLSDELLRPLSAGLKWSLEPRLLREGGYEGGDAMIYYDRPTHPIKPAARLTR